MTRTNWGHALEVAGEAGMLPVTLAETFDFLVTLELIPDTPNAYKYLSRLTHKPIVPSVEGRQTWDRAVRNGWDRTA